MDNSSPLTLALVAAQDQNWQQVSNLLPQLDPQLDAQQILDLSIQLLTQGNFQDAWLLTKVLPTLGARAVPPLVTLLQDTEFPAETQWFVGKILSSFQAGLVIRELVACLQPPTTATQQVIVLQALTDLGVPAIQYITALLSEPAQHQTAVFALAQIRHSHTIEPLLTVVNDPDPQIRSTAIEALGSFHDDRVAPLLLTKLKDPSSLVRQAAVVSLGMRPELAIELQLVDQLRPMLKDINPAVYGAAAIALGRMGSDDAALALWNCYEQPTCPADLQAQIIAALGWIDSAQSLGYLRQILWTAQVEQWAAFAVRSMGLQISQKLTIIQILQEYLQQPSANATVSTRQEIATVLGNISSPETVELLRLLLADPDERIRWQASYYLQQRSI
jgi:HEAT repeat protein